MSTTTMNTALPLASVSAEHLARLRVLVERHEKWERKSAEAEERADRLQRRADRLNERRLLARNELRDHLAFEMGLCDRIDPMDDLAPAVLAGDKVVTLERVAGVKGGYAFSVRPLLDPAGAPAA